MVASEWAVCVFFPYNHWFHHKSIAFDSVSSKYLACFSAIKPSEHGITLKTFNVGVSWVRHIMLVRMFELGVGGQYNVWWRYKCHYRTNREMNAIAQLPFCLAESNCGPIGHWKLEWPAMLIKQNVCVPPATPAVGVLHSWLRNHAKCVIVGMGRVKVTTLIIDRILH